MDTEGTLESFGFAALYRETLILFAYLVDPLLPTILEADGILLQSGHSRSHQLAC